MRADFHRCLQMFSALASLELDSDDQKNLVKLSEILERADVFVLMKRDGPALMALLRHFGLIEPTAAARARLDQLDPEIVCRALTTFHRFKHCLVALIKTKDFITQAEFTYSQKALVQGSDHATSLNKHGG